MSTPNGREQEFHQLDLNLHPNEASGLLVIEDGPLLEAHDWEYGLWVVMDEAEAEHFVGTIGHKRPGASVPGAGGLRGVCYAEPGGRKTGEPCPRVRLYRQHRGRGFPGRRVFARRAAVPGRGGGTSDPDGPRRYRAPLRAGRRRIAGGRGLYLGVRLRPTRLLGSGVDQTIGGLWWIEG